MAAGIWAANARERTRMTAQAKFAARLRLSHDRDTAALREGPFTSLGLTIMARPLPLLALAVIHICSHQQFKAHSISALCAERKFVSRLEACTVRQAMFGVRNPIYPRLGYYLTRFVNSPAGIGSHALDRVAWGT